MTGLVAWLLFWVILGYLGAGDLLLRPIAALLNWWHRDEIEAAQQAENRLIQEAWSINYPEAT